MRRYIIYMGVENIITEFQKVILIEEAYKPMKEARLSVLRMREVLEYLNQNKFLKEAINSKPIEEKMDLLDIEFTSLEESMGVKDRSDFVMGDVEPKYLSIEDLVDKIHEYMKLKTLVDEQTAELLYIIRDYLYVKAMQTVNQINQVRPSAALNFIATINNDSSLGLNKVSLEHDKIITYIIDSKDFKNKSVLDTMDIGNKQNKVRDYNHQIMTTYEEINLLYKNSMELNKVEIEVESLIQSEKITYYLFVFGFITVFLTGITTILSFFSFWKINDTDDLLRMFLYTLRFFLSDYV